MTPLASNATSSESPRTAPARTSRDDLDQARRLARALRGEAPAPPGPAPTPAAYSRFGVAPHGPRVPGIGADGWKRLLADVITLTRAQAVFAIDESGLLVAGVGIERDEAEGMGSRLVVALGHLDQMAQQVCRSVSVELPGGLTVTGFRGGSGAGGVITLVVRTAAALPDATRAAVLGLLQPA